MVSTYLISPIPRTNQLVIRSSLMARCWLCVNVMEMVMAASMRKASGKVPAATVTGSYPTMRASATTSPRSGRPSPSRSACMSTLVFFNC